MAQDTQPPTGSVQHDEPAYQDVETREETVARVVDAGEAVGAERGGSADPSSRRGLNRTLGRALAIFALAGAIVGAVLGLVLSISVGYVVALAAAGALATAVVGALLTLAREDGRVEREVEEATGKGPQGAGSPGAPEDDLTER